MLRQASKKQTAADPAPSAQRRGCLGSPAAPRLQAPPGWDAALECNELALLQRHLLRELLGPTKGAGTTGGGAIAVHSLMHDGEKTAAQSECWGLLGAYVMLRLYLVYSQSSVCPGGPHALPASQGTLPCPS